MVKYDVLEMFIGLFDDFLYDFFSIMAQKENFKFMDILIKNFFVNLKVVMRRSWYSSLVIQSRITWLDASF